MSNYNHNNAPPAYQSQQPKKYGASNEESARPLLSPVPGTSAGAFYDQPSPGDIPDDFKYGTTVADSAPEIRNAFVRKVYSILFAQILATCIVGGVISQSHNAIVWVQSKSVRMPSVPPSQSVSQKFYYSLWAFYVPLFGTIVILGLLYWKRHSHPLNLVLLSVFTLFESFTLGVMVAFFDNRIVLQAFPRRYDFDGMGPWLFGGLIALMMTGFIGIFIPFSKTFDLIMAIGGCLLFSGYIVYDTHVINSRLSPDEYIMGSISLYLDFVNLFINILRLLNNMQER
ncbi:hypothetical protein NLI96_g3550 [Meripilus lineatus]|uniref:Uncharacterized protein n=1 Tax=Meripilus lineatus TaxID=2056292 RepID=A0AAD5YGH1_9APHY|nr:hypothetical protein NLI96_g3550 [Physisporinus lineatus]